MTNQVLLPKTTIAQKLDRNLLFNFCNFIQEKVEILYQENTEEYIVQDGPPYANGDLHLGHLLNKTLKDFYIKYMLLQGKKVRTKFGWDCHGLPIENKAKNMPGDLLENCKDIALTYRAKQKESINLYGIFSTEEDYLTMNEDYIGRELNVFNELNDKGVIFKKNKPTWYSPTLKTVLANSEIEYKDVTDESLYVLFPVCPQYSLLVWTTTEWTLSGNQAVCLNTNIKYCLATFENDIFVCSEKFAQSNGYSFTEFDVSELSSYFNLDYKACPVLFDEFVSDTETGIVHLSGGHGDEDFNVLSKNNIEPKNVVSLDNLAEHITSFKASDNFVFKRVPFTHSYPIDWRVKEKVVKVLTEQTYLDFDWTKIKAATKQIKLSSKDRTRLESMLFSRKDWCLSRQRKWGVQIPNSNDILDVWFDSGTAFTMFDKPADLYIEGTDQHRGWFQSSIIIAAMVDKIPTKRILTHGFVVDELGEKLAKSSGNFQYLKELYDLYNPDVMRLWVLLSDYKNEIVFSKDSVDSAGKQYFRLRNFMRYLVNNLHRDTHEASKVRPELIKKLENLKATIKQDVDNFDLNKATRNFTNFTNEYSSYLTEDMKNKFYESEIDSDFRITLENEFHYLAHELSGILFPFLPFLSAEISLAI